NVEMVEVTGGRFWAPYKSEAAATEPAAEKLSVPGIAAAEFFNEPNLAVMGGAPKGYDAAAYGHDFRAFLPFIRKAAPGLLVLGPGSVGEGGLLASFPGIKSEDMLTATGPGLDAFSYHFYGGVSKRCAGRA